MGIRKVPIAVIPVDYDNKKVYQIILNQEYHYNQQHSFYITKKKVQDTALDVELADGQRR